MLIMLRFFPLLLLLCSNHLLFAVSDDSIYNNFSKCLEKNSIPNDQITKILYGQSSPSFSSVLDAYVRNRRCNTSSTLKPVLIITPLQINHIQAAISCTKSLGLLLKTRSGGHDYEGISYTAKTLFVIIDMFNLRTITIDLPSETVSVQAGATLGELYYRIQEKSKVHGFPAGVCPTIGVGGHISGGGYGTMLRRDGLSVDNVIDAQIADVNSRVMDKTAMGEDLFWAIKGGGGGSFGVVLSYKLKLVKVPEIVTVFKVLKTMDQKLTDVLYKWQQVQPKMDNNLFIRVLLQPITLNNQKEVRGTFVALYLGDSNKLLSMMNSEFPELGVNKTDCEEISWAQSLLWWANSNASLPLVTLLNRKPPSVSFLKRKSDYVREPISKDGLNLIFKKLAQIGQIGLVFNPYGGKMSQIPETDTPFPHRRGVLYKIQYSVSWGEEETAKEKEFIGQTREMYEFMTPYVSKNPREAFLNYRDLDIGVTDHGKNSINDGKVYGPKYFKGNYDKLVKVKSVVDPENFFRNEQSIPVVAKA